MDERTTGVDGGQLVETVSAEDGDRQPDASTDDPRAIERQIDDVRAELGELLDELDRRRHELLDIRLQARRHPGVVAAFAFVGAAAMIATIVWTRNRLRPISRAEQAQNFGRALALIAKDPQKLVDALEQRKDARAAIIAALAKVIGSAAPFAAGRVQARA